MLECSSGMDRNAAHWLSSVWMGGPMWFTLTPHRHGMEL